MPKTNFKPKDLSLLSKLREEDIIEKFIRASGPGGQFVNKTSSCVYLKHIPTGIEVKCQRERSQALNRFVARKLLADKIKAYQLKQINKAREEAQKIRRQQRKRSAGLKRKILEDKRRLSQKKRLRFKRIELD
jgi:protein subunit release factor B